MKILFVHQNMPGQYKHLVPALVGDSNNQVAFITKEGKPDLDGVLKSTYGLTRKPTPNIHQYLARFEDQVLHGQGAVRAGLELRKRGFLPDVICAHTGWGEALFLRDAFPEARILAFSEFYYNSKGADIDFAPDHTPNLDRDCRTRIRNAHMLMSLEAADWGISPTWWQWSRHPEVIRDRISVIHDGVDTDLCSADPNTVLELPNGERLSRDDEVVTYIARNFEPYRGFDLFMQSIKGILDRRPKARIVLVGGDDVSYGSPPPNGGNWREYMQSRTNFDPRRVHFMSRVPYSVFQQVLSISRAHVYLTYPFVLSWSMLEAMSHECMLIASRTAPVTEVIKDGKNGRLVDFYNPAEVTDAVVAALEDQAATIALRKSARETVVRDYDLRKVCLPAQIDLISTLGENRRPPRTELPCTAPTAS
ncbi:MAG: glycosyltransferase family 4 protein [Alphaproteobacteria bacterium]|nr:glycosyltransferase family 4 protein [Alphaproteobacteria bacterium]